MTVKPGRKFSGLEMENVDLFVEEEHKLVADGKEFLDNLHMVKIFRESDPEKVYTAKDWQGERFTRLEVQAEDWVFHDTQQCPEEAAAVAKKEGRMLSREDVLAAVHFVVGRWHYTNADSLKIAPAVAKYLGFPE